MLQKTTLVILIVFVAASVIANKRDRRAVYDIIPKLKVVVKNHQEPGTPGTECKCINTGAFKCILDSKMECRRLFSPKPMKRSPSLWSKVMMSSKKMKKTRKMKHRYRTWIRNLRKFLGISTQKEQKQQKTKEENNKLGHLTWPDPTIGNIMKSKT